MTTPFCKNKAAFAKLKVDPTQKYKSSIAGVPSFWLVIDEAVRYNRDV